jgi:hypothetical protein
MTIYRGEDLFESAGNPPTHVNPGFQAAFESGWRGWLTHLVWLGSMAWTLYLVLDNQPIGTIVFAILGIALACLIALIGMTASGMGRLGFDKRLNPQVAELWPEAWLDE